MVEAETKIKSKLMSSQDGSKGVKDYTSLISELAKTQLYQVE